MVTLGGLRFAAFGTLIGRTAAWVVTRLYSLDPLTYAGATAGLLVVAALACAVPAIQAGRLDPLRTLQNN